MYNLFRKVKQKVYFIKKEDIKDDSGKSVIMYGISSENYSYSSITSDINKISLLCDLCNALELDEDQLCDVVEDFLISFA